MLKHQLLEDKGILILKPNNRLTEEDFTLLAKEVVDPYLEKHHSLHGLMIYTESFPGWNNFAALISHLKFVRDHQRQIEKVAAVTDSGFLSVMPKIADHFLRAKVQHFDYQDKDRALLWLAE